MFYIAYSFSSSPWSQFIVFMIFAAFARSGAAFIIPIISVSCSDRTYTL